jgi:signal transduction histidine kinase
MRKGAALRLLGQGGMRGQLGIVFALVTLIPLLASSYLVTRYVFPSAAARGDAIAVMASTVLLCGLGWIVIIGIGREVQRIAGRAREVVEAGSDSDDAAAALESADEIQSLDSALQGIDETVQSQVRLLSEKANEIRFLMRSLEVANEELSSLHRMKSEIISLATHEFRNPLQTIIETVSLFEDGILGDVDEEQKQFIANVGASARTLDRIVGQMVMLAHLGEGAERSSRKVQPIGPIVEEVVERSRDLAARRGCRLELAASSNGASVAAERDDLMVALRSALGSLLRRLQRDGCLKATVHEDREFVRCSFAAAPLQMSDEHRERFVAIAAGKTGKVQDWSGLAELELPLAKEIIQLQGGSLAARSDGARVVLSIVLPAVSPALGSTAQASVP